MPPPAPSPAGGACPGGRVVAQFRKSTSCRDLRPSFPGSCPRPRRTRREEPAPAGGSLRNFANPNPPRPVPVFPRVVPQPAPSPAGRACPGGRVVAQFRKNHVRRDRCPSFRRVVPRPGSNPARGHLPRREGYCAISQEPRPPQPVPALPRVGPPPVPPPTIAHRAKRHSALPCPDREQQESEPQKTQTTQNRPRRTGGGSSPWPRVRSDHLRYLRFQSLPAVSWGVKV